MKTSHTRTANWREIKVIPRSSKQLDRLPWQPASVPMGHHGNPHEDPKQSLPKRRRSKSTRNGCRHATEPRSREAREPHGQCSTDRVHVNERPGSTTKQVAPYASTCGKMILHEPIGVTSVLPTSARPVQKTRDDQKKKKKHTQTHHTKTQGNTTVTTPRRSAAVDPGPDQTGGATPWSSSKWLARFSYTGGCEIRSRSTLRLHKGPAQERSDRSNLCGSILRGPERRSGGRGSWQSPRGCQRQPLRSKKMSAGRRLPLGPAEVPNGSGRRRGKRRRSFSSSAEEAESWEAVKRMSRCAGPDHSRSRPRHGPATGPCSSPQRAQEVSVSHRRVRNGEV